MAATEDKDGQQASGAGRAAGTSSGHRVDFLLIAEMVSEKARVLDVGCGDGELLDLLLSRRGADGRGMEISRAGVNRCVARGLPVIQGDADKDLADYPTDAFDFVILSQTLQATRYPRRVLEQMLRVGRRAIVSFPNFGHWRVRTSLFFGGRMPVTENLPDTWYNTSNIHFCTLRDFTDLCGEMGVIIEKAVALNTYGQRMKLGSAMMANLLGQQAVFLLKRQL